MAGLDGLVNNAGVAFPGRWRRCRSRTSAVRSRSTSPDRWPSPRRCSRLIRKARGRVVFLSSIGGRIAFPLTGAYHAAKFGIEAVGDIFRQELRPWGISVSIVEPGSIDTPIWERGEGEADEIGQRAPADRRTSTARRSRLSAR